MLDVTEDVDSDMLLNQMESKEDEGSSSSSSKTNKAKPTTRQDSKKKKPHIEPSSDRVLCSRKRAAEIVNMVIDAGDMDDLF